MLIQSTSQIHSEPLKMLVYGESGIGKTTQVASLIAAGFKPIVISAEGGLRSLSVPVDYVDITKDAEGKPLERGAARAGRIRELYEFLMTDEGKEKYDTIVFDTLTEVASALVTGAIAAETEKEKSDVRRAWGDYAQTLMKMVYVFRDIPHYNTVFLCQEDLDKDAQTGRRFYSFDIPGQAAKGPLRASLDIIYRMFMNEEGVRQFQTQLSNNVVAKHRGGTLQMFEPAHLGAIMKILKEGEVK